MHDNIELGPDELIRPGAHGSGVRCEELSAKLAEHLSALEKVTTTELGDFNALVKEEAVPPVMVPTT